MAESQMEGEKAPESVFEEKPVSEQKNIFWI